MIRQCLLLFALGFSATAANNLASRDGAVLYGQCGGTGYTGPTTCAEGSCSYFNSFYSQCVPGPPNPAPTTSTPIILPSTFNWSSTDALIGPKDDGTGVQAIKDPSVIFFNGTWHVFTSTASDANGYSLLYMNFTDWSEAGNASFYYLNQAPIGLGYRAAPEIFYFTPQNLWYLVYQNGNSAYSTNTDIRDPSAWTAPQTFYPSEPELIQENIGNGYWVDMWVICDDDNCHLFSSDDNGHLYRSQTPKTSFPNNMTQPVIAMEDPNPFNLYEASNVYKYGENQYLLLVECIGSDGHRFFRSWTMSDIAGPYTPLADTEANPFARSNNVVFNGTPWTIDISHGEMIRSSHDESLAINPYNLQYLYQGDNPNNTADDYNAIPWRLALLTQKNPPLYGQCGGQNYTGPTTCDEGVCTFWNPYYSQCIPALD